MPRATPISGRGVPSPAACTDAHTNRAVSRPSRPTARNAVATSAPVPMASAASSLPCSSDFRCRAVRRIQKTIQVTRPTARIDREPPRASCASNVSSWEPNSRAQPKPRASGDRDADADPDRPQGVPAARLHQVGDEDADDQAGLQALAQTDQVVGEHAVPSLLRSCLGNAYLSRRRPTPQRPPPAVHHVW